MDAPAADDPPLQLWVWWARESDGGWTQITAHLPGFEHLGALPLSHRRRDVAERMRDAAVAHASAHGQPVKLVHMQQVEVLEVRRPRPQG